MNTAQQTKAQIDRTLRQFQMAGEIIEYGGSVAWAVGGTTVLFYNTYAQKPVWFSHPPCDIVPLKDPNMNYIGLVLTPIGGQAGDTYNFMAICRDRCMPYVAPP
jgi:hypothetical protein